MKRAELLTAALLFWAGLFAGVGRAETAPSVPAETPPALRELLLAADDEEEPLLDSDDLAYFAQLPEHARKLLALKVEEEWVTSGEHLRELLRLRLSPAGFEVAMGDTCFLCHTDAESQSEDTLFSRDPAASETNPHLNLEHYASDVHFRRGLSCAGCHGGDPAEAMDHDFPDTWPTTARRRHEDRAWVPEFCASCHSDTAFMRKYNPELPTDQLAKYRESRHGKALLGGSNPRAAECTSCHGVHGIQGANSPESHVYPTQVPEMCGSCHANEKIMAGTLLPDGSPLPTDQLEAYRSSVHGRALLEKGDLGAPACNDCHGNHAAMPPEISSIAQVCRTCHAHNGELFDGSTHKKAFDENGWPECGGCHGDHAVTRLDDSAFLAQAGGLCHDCHEKHARNNSECAATADHFHSVLTGFVHQHEEFSHRAEKIARRGLDVEAMETALVSLSDTLKQSRSAIHAFDRSQFDSTAEPGREAIAEMEKLVVEAKAEFNARLVGLLVAAAFLLATILTLWMKLRRIERGDS